MHSCKLRTSVSWLFQMVAASLLAQTLFFKFSGAEESRWIFSALGVEPWGRFAAGFAELVAVILLLTPRLATVGAMLSLGLMAGAIGAHLTRLGIEVAEDGGLLFGLALTVFGSAASILVIRREQIPFFGRYFTPAAGLACASGACRQ
jgi:putative oxidoreductase